MFHEIEGDLLALPAPADVIAHQCNTVGVAGGLAGAIVRQYPEARPRNDARMYGSIDFVPIDNAFIRGTGRDHFYVANLYAQLLPGAPTYGLDGAAQRLFAFNKCLDALYAQMQQVGATSVAFPCRIGCDLGGGDWEQYRRALRKWYAQRAGWHDEAGCHDHPDVFIIELKR